MTKYCKPIIVTVVAVAIWVAGGWAQQTTPAPKPGSTLNIEGKVTSLDLQPAPASSVLMVTTSDGKMYMVHVGPMGNLQRQGFNPKVGDTIKATGIACCQSFGHITIHTREVTLAGKTYLTPDAAMPADCCCMPAGKTAAAKK